MYSPLKDAVVKVLRYTPQQADYIQRISIYIYTIYSDINECQTENGGCTQTLMDFICALERYRYDTT